MVETRDASPSNLLIKIQPFSLLSENGIFTYRSTVFEADGYKWNVTIVFPKKDGKHVGIYLSVVETTNLPRNWEINAIATFFIYNHIPDNYLSFRGKVQRLHALSYKSGLSRLISKESLMDVSKGYIVEDSCVFGAEVFVIKPHKRVVECLYLQRSTTPYKHKLELKRFSKLGKVWKSQEFTDRTDTWKVYVYPRGELSGESDFISIYLECVRCKNIVRGHLKHKAEIGITIINNHTTIHESQNFNHWFTWWGPDFGFPTFMPIADMKDPTKGFLVKDSCFLQIEISRQARTFS